MTSAVLANMEARYSCRGFSAQEVSEDDLNEILRAGQIAPSACNLQPYFFYVVRGESLRQLNSMRSWYEAPVLIVGCLCEQQGWQRGSDGLSFKQFDLALAMGQMALRATDLGLGSCFIASFTSYKLQEALKLPAEHCPEIVLAVGHPEANLVKNAQHTTRKSKSELVGYRS